MCARKTTKTDDGKDKPIIIKKYANRRLYNMSESCYIVLEDLAKMIRAGQDFIVYDAKTNEDITRSILTQIIFEEEGKGNHMLPQSFLRDMIKFYGENISAFSPDYWEASMSFFKQNQDKLRNNFEQALDSANFPFKQFQKVADNNREIMKKTFEMFSLFGHKEEEMISIPKSEYEFLKKEIERLTAKGK